MAEPASRRGLKQLLDNPWCEFVVGLILLLSGAVELWASFRDKLPWGGLRLHHTVIILGGAIVLRSLPAMFLGLEFVDEAAAGVRSRYHTVLRGLDQIARSHAMDLFVGAILVVGGLADLLSHLNRAGTLFRLNVSYGVIAFGLAPFLNAFVALFKGLKRLDRERGLLPRVARYGLLDRAVKNPYIGIAAGLIMVGSGLMEVWATLTQKLVFPHGIILVHSLLLFGTFGLLNALPELFLGLRQLFRAVSPRISE